MATTADNKLYVAIGILAVLGGALFFATKKEKEEAATYTLSGQAAQLPKITVTEEDVKAIDKIVLTKAGEDGGAGTDVELVKKGEEWRVARPADALANQANVKSLLDNIKSLKVSELIDSGKSSYEKFKVGDTQGLHAVFSKGGSTVLDVRFGENGGRGQMTRIAGKDGVYAIKGYSSYLYDRELKGWRDTTLFKFEDTAVTSAVITNEHGTFNFDKLGTNFSGKFKPAKGGGSKDIEKFDTNKVSDFLRAYKSLNADGFADKDKTPKDLGLEPPAATVLITLNDGAKRELKLGSKAEGSSRWVQASGVPELVSISSWAAEWALAEPKKFQKADDAKKDEAKKEEGDEDPHGHAAPPTTPPPTTAPPTTSAKSTAPKPEAPKPAAPATPPPSPSAG
jgi:hypothetical protein